MKVFVSSTCYDLVDLRAELFEDLRDLGVDPVMSDLKESDFETTGDHVGNSIETCLANLRACDAVVFILSRRYGPFLKRGYDDLSATHVEYNEARKEKKRIHFYVRDRLIGEWTTWKAHARPSDFAPTWAESNHDALGLFNLIFQHQRLQGGGEDPGTNNWFWPYTDSLDLRRDLRKRLGADAYRSTGEKLVRAGQVPILMVNGQGVSTVGEHGGYEAGHQRLTFYVVNAGPVAALGVQGDLLYNGDLLAGGNDSRIGVVLPGVLDYPARVLFDVPRQTIRQLFGEEPVGQSPPVTLSLNLGYDIPSGHTLRDRFTIDLIRRDQDILFLRVPDYGGKDIVRYRDFLQPG